MPIPCNDDTPRTDIAILGAGPTGLALATALAGSPFSVTLIDAGDATRADHDPRALALSEGSRLLLQRFGAWPGNATAISAIEVTQADGPGRTTLRADEEHLPALGWVCRYGELVRSLQEGLANSRKSRPGAAVLPTVQQRWNTRITAQTPVIGPPLGTGLRLTFSDGSALLCRLLVHAEGAQENDGIVSDYQQQAIVCTAKPAEGHGQTAHERFTPEGPLALLPLGDDYAVVLTANQEQHASLLALDDCAFSKHLSERLGGAICFEQVGPRAAFPLKLRLRKHLTQGREVWIGNAAQTLHPVSGQGFNLALRDAWTLADTLRPCTTPFALREHELRAWSRRRQLDRMGSVALTDGLVRLFSNDLMPLRLVRGLGLTLFDQLPGAKHFLARRMIYGARGW